MHLPQEKHIGISQRIENEHEREALRERIARLLPSANETGGYIVRTVAEGASDEALTDDIEYLRKLWCDILEEAKKPRLRTCCIRNCPWGSVCCATSLTPIPSNTIDSRENFQEARPLPESTRRPSCRCSTTTSASAPYSICTGSVQEIERALARRVDLKSGGYLVFDQTER